MSVEALQAALAAEYAAIYGYGVVGSYLADPLRATARQAEAEHRDRRDTTSLRIEELGGSLVASEPAYALPFAVTDPASALRLAVALEEGAAGAWRSALGGTTDRDREFALDAYIACAVMATRWREAAGLSPLTLPFPGAT